MIFSFLQYIQPVDYFNLVRHDGSSIFPDPDLLPASALMHLTLDTLYQTREAQRRDLAWQAIQRGYIGHAGTLCYNETVSLADEYHFVRKYFHWIWAFYVLCLRLLTLHNPIRELSAFHQTRKVKRVNLYEDPITYPDWFMYESILLRQMPKITVVIPTLNRYQYLKDVLQDLEKQDYANFDVIVVDQSEPFQPGFYNQFRLKINVIYQSNKAICQARDTGILSTDAEYLLLFDDDSRVEADWISNHLKCLDFFTASISSGTSISLIGSKVPESYRYFKVSNQIDTGNVMLKRDVFRKIGLFDHQLEKIGLEDAELGLRAHSAGILNVSNPFAQRLHLKAGTGGFREIGIWDSVRSTRLFAPKPTPSALYISRKYFGKKLAIYSLLPAIPPSLLPLRLKRDRRMIIVSCFLFLVFFPVVLVQVYVSWRIAGKKLMEGNKIGSLTPA
jgi:GT2 family glycosyltransferase